jgi:hypothetical protein
MHAKFFISRRSKGSFMNTEEYHLVLPVKLGPSSYGGGWAAGSVIAHWFHLKKGNPGVFWVWPLTSSGIKREHKPLVYTWKIAMGREIQVNGEFGCISPRGFFYEANSHSIAWQFEAECIIRTWDFILENEKAAEELKRLKDCIPLFRQEYLKAPWHNFRLWGDWLLIRKINRLKKTIKGQSMDGGFSFPKFKYFSNPKEEVVGLTSPDHLRGGNAFILQCPEEMKFLDPDPETEISSHLKQFLAANPPPGKLRERIIHDAFLIKLLKEGYVIENERGVAGGRLDVLFRSEKQNLIAVEFKLRRGDSAIDQLEGYINELQKNYRTGIHGVIVCGQADEELKRRAKKRDFEVIEYKLDLDIPLRILAT